MIGGAAVCRCYISIRITGLERFGGIGLPALFAPRIIATEIHRDRVKPSHEFRARSKSLNAEIEAHESLLQNVARGFLVTGIAADEPEKRLLIFANQFIERAFIARLQSKHQRQIEVWL